MNLLPLLTINAVLFIILLILTLFEKIFLRYGDCKITINKKKELTVQGGENLLQALSEQKIYIPSACGGKATCGHCKVQVVKGGGPILPTEEIFITSEQKAEGYRLACQVKIKEDLEITIPEHILETREYSAVLENKVSVTHDIVELTILLQEPAQMKFQPGQYVQFLVPGTNEFRAYSIASSPSLVPRIKLLVRLVPGGLCSSYIHEVLSVNDRITLTGPYGEFFLQQESKRSIICIAGGCGMAPIQSILQYQIEQGMPRPFLFFFGARTQKDLFYTEALREIEKKYPKFQYIPALSEADESGSWEGETGLVTEVVARHLTDGGNFEAYMCGPPPMIDAATGVLQNKGIDESKIYYDKF
ncbi:MAG: 2Fe-2S iron-sulfur cluster binding domain-containing protein [Spirochaetia bacterium]|jgi:Na+-transporting NADH:ubiquinone oxidoreductase subunit F